MAASVSVVVTLHDLGDREYVYRIGNLVNSLAEMTTLPERVVVVDTSEHIHRFDCDSALYYYVKYHAPTFNKSKALNTGLQHVSSEYVMFTDADMMFHPDTLTEVMNVVGYNRMVLAYCYYLPRDLVLTHPFNWTLIQSVGHCPGSHTSPGTIQVASREWFVKVHGYDERFEGGLGGMDDDMINRAAKDGLTPTWITKPLCYHQWHERSGLKGVCSHLFEHDPAVVKNI